MIGQTISHYRILEKLGAGGMGEVYRAEDTNLHRYVAIKVLPDEFACDAERLARFQREAHVLASLNHPNIATVHGLEESGGMRFIVMELVEGQSLAQRLQKGQFPIDEALETSRQIAEGLEAAHEKGVIHRDLKPGNVMLTPDDKVKILDFGLARVSESHTSVVDQTHSPTITEAMTKAGVILGTAAYMSPEQAKGKTVDRRADIWAFGVILYEMLAARRPFRGEDVSDTLAAVLATDPDWNALPGNTPQSIRHLLRRCLQRDPRKRLSAIGDARLEIEEDSFGSSVGGTAAVSSGPAPRPWWLSALPWALAGILGIALLSGLLLWRFSRPVAEPARITLALSPDDSLEIVGGPAISPEGRMVVFAARSGEKASLYLRRIDEWEPRPIPGTEGARAPFFSPDGKWIAFRRGGALEKVAASGGTSQVVCKDSGYSGRWRDEGTIVFGRWPKAGLWRVSSGGGTAQLIAKPGDAAEGSTLRFVDPEPLPGDRGVLFTIWKEGRTSIAVLPPGSDKPQIVVEEGALPRFLPTGHLVYLAGSRLFAVPFDVKRLEVHGGTIPVVEEVGPYTLGIPTYDVSVTGVLVFQPAMATASNVVWKERQGMTVSIAAPVGQYEYPSLSPDGERFSVVIRDGPSRSIWTGGAAGEPLTRLTFGNDDWYGVWSHDGQRLFYLSGQNGTYNTHWIRADGSGKPERLTRSPNPQNPTSVSPRGDVVLYNDIDPTTQADIRALSLVSGNAWPVIQTQFSEYNAKFSPDGNWIAYNSNESGRLEVYVQAYPGPGMKKRVSLEGGYSPFWSHSGRELFYRTSTALFSVPVIDAHDFKLGSPRRLFLLPKGAAYGSNCLNADDQRFLMLETAGITSQLSLVQNWFEELKRLCPAGEN